MALDDHMLHIGLDQRLSAYRSGGISRYALELGTALELVPDLRVTRIRRKRGAESSAGDLVLRTPAHHRIEPLMIGTELALRRQSFDVYHATDFVAPRLDALPGSSDGSRSRIPALAQSTKPRCARLLPQS